MCRIKLLWKIKAMKRRRLITVRLVNKNEHVHE